LDERKLIEKLRREREEERATEELQRLQAENGGKVVTKRVDWMYNGTTDGDGSAGGDDREAYLLGKRRIDNLLKNDAQTQNLQKGAAVGIDAVGDTNANTARDTQKKVLQDPLLMIQKQKMEMQLKAMKTAQKEAQYKEKRDKEKERERKHSHKHRDRERSRDREHKHRSRHDRDRSRSPRRREDRDSYRRRSKSRSRSPYRKHSSRPERSRSPRRREDRGDIRDRDNYRRRDRSPRRHPGYTEKEDRRRPPGDTMKEDNKADRLAQMQAEAASLEQERAKRVGEQELRDAEEEDKHKKSMDGGRRFISNVRGQASNMDLGDAIARGRQNHRVAGDDA
jgi:hypothetical protein